MLWRLGENIDPGYLQMFILPHIAFVCFSFLFNKVLEKTLFFSHLRRYSIKQHELRAFLTDPILGDHYLEGH